jgi:hypothetical protein
MIRDQVEDMIIKGVQKIIIFTDAQAALNPIQHYLFIYSISFNDIQPMWLCRKIQTHKIADMSERRKQANKQKKTKQHA